MIVLDLKDLYGETAKLSLLPAYLDQALQLAGEGQEAASLKSHCKGSGTALVDGALALDSMPEACHLYAMANLQATALRTQR